MGSDFDDELGSGDLQDVVRWEVRLVKDNDRVLEIGSITTARPLAEEALERANDLATALAVMCEKPVKTGEIPAWALEDYADLDSPDTASEDEMIEADREAGEIDPVDPEA